MPALSLAADSSVVTACGNDYGFDELFARQLQGLANPGDLFVGLSTSGNSKNIIRALAVARERGVKSVILTGESGGEIMQSHRSLVDCMIRVPSSITARIQEAHILIGHIICALVEEQLFGMQ